MSFGLGCFGEIGSSGVRGFGVNEFVDFELAAEAVLLTGGTWGP